MIAVILNDYLSNTSYSLEPFRKRFNLLLTPIEASIKLWLIQLLNYNININYRE